ncbi:hypothetical protein GCM10010988_14150 [Cnuibacter physcomitrellae]|uniref:Uncharacterized protein n=1 Tax=Cnuibacter physcomitrellae TaxID=1619308 RepID=A0A1X9LP36_9MICO|nr:DUF998 domain-containing protein [Cnuibacter physcomitrellae]ARJ06212.1 hypothetical protein B5808_14025 [Cnuibacter physcomitrellae]GGI37474.1 hypothetical protein GCM10010988_14150 [Cnuibacter physcomitrellae]
MTRTSLRTAALVIAAGAALTGLVLIWVARLSATRFLYVSELGADGEPTAVVFRWAMTLVAASAAITAVWAGSIRPGVRWMASVAPPVVLAVAAVSFGVASQVTCTRYCPIPYGPSFTWQDFTHTSFAVVGFAAGCFVMLQVAVDRAHRTLARFSIASAVAVGAIAATGGLLSLARFAVELGGVLELIATTIALLWLVGLAVLLARAPAREVIPDAEARGPVTDRRTTVTRRDIPPAVFD